MRRISQIGGHIVKRRLQAAFDLLTRLYARDLFTSVVLQGLVVITLVEAIFLAERFPMVFRDVLKAHASLLDTGLLFALTSTQIFDLALPIAILMAVYWTILRMRENREMLVLFGAGAGPYQLAGLILTVAFAAQIGSLVVSGVIDPASRYAQRVILFDAEFRALAGGINTGQFYFFPNRVAFAPAQSTPGSRSNPNQTRRLFVYEQTKAGAFRVITADHALLDGPDPSGTLLLTLGGVTSRTFSDTRSSARTAQGPTHVNGRTCANCRAQAGHDSSATLFAQDVTRQMTVDELLTFLPRGSEVNELTILEQLGARADSSSPKHRKEMQLLSERLARSFLCLLAPLIALVSVCLTSRTTNYFVLPLACMTLMSLNLTSGWLIRSIGPSSPVEALTVPAALTVLLMPMLLTAIVRKQGELVRPQFARP